MHISFKEIVINLRLYFQTAQPPIAQSATVPETHFYLRLIQINYRTRRTGGLIPDLMISSRKAGKPQEQELGPLGTIRIGKDGLTKVLEGLSQD